MKAIVVDLELTQNPGEKPTIIQIGACLINSKSHQIQGIFDEITNGGSEPNEFITQLTRITVEQVQAARPLRDVLIDFWKWVEEAGVGGSLFDWGGGDVRALREASRELNVEVPRLHALDLKEMSKLFRQAKNAKAKGGLANTLSLFGMEFYKSELQHNALYDAVNTSFLLFRFEEIISFGIGVEKTHGNPKVRNLNEARVEFEKLVEKKRI